MSDANEQSLIVSRIWFEEPDPGNPFAAHAAFCRGYDVYGEMLGRARWVEMLYLLFHDDAPTPRQADLLEALAVALANPGPRDASVHAAMCGGATGSTAASSLIAALAVGAGHLYGGREVYLAMENWNACGTDLPTWRERLCTPHADVARIWEAPEHPPGFDPNGLTTALVVKQSLACMAGLSPGTNLRWLSEHLAALEELAGRPLSLAGVAAAAFSDLRFTPEQGEMCHLLLRLPGAAAHALEQRGYGHRQFPFYTVEVENEQVRENP